MKIPVKDVARIPRAPRQVVRTGIWKAAPAAWIGGWIFSGLGLFFLSFMGFVQISSRPGSLLPDFFIERNFGMADGQVTQSIWISSSKGSHTFRFDYVFSLESDAPVSGFCFASESLYEEGDVVEVEYLKDNPELSRIRGTRAARVHYLFFAIVNVFWVAGLLTLASAISKRNRVKRVLVNGTVVQGLVTDVVLMRSMKINKIPPWKVKYEFKPQSGTMLTSHVYIYPETNKNPPQPAGSNQPCVVIYDEANPRHNTLAYEDDFS